MDTRQLQELRAESGKRLPDHVIHGITRFAPDRKLPVQLTIANGRPVAKWGGGAGGGALRSEQKFKTLGPEPNDNLALQLNDALLGGADYPILGAVMGTAVGVGTGGAGFLFTVATTALSVAKSTRRVLARDGDELWRVEEIGKVLRAGLPVPTLLTAYFLVDPFRGQSSGSRGWLLHEARYDIIG